MEENCSSSRNGKQPFHISKRLTNGKQSLNEPQTIT